MKLWWLQCSWCLSTVNTCRIDLRALLRPHCPALNYALCTRSHQRSWDRGLLTSSQPESYEEYKWLQHISDSCTLRRALRETHAIQPMHTLTRHTTCAAIWQWKGRNQMRPGEISKSSGILLKLHTCSQWICIAFLWVVHKLVRLRPPLLNSVCFALVEVSRGSG